VDTMDTEGGTVEWLTLREAAQRVDTSTKTLRRKAIAGELLAQRAGESDTSPWLISSVSLAAMYGEITEAAAQAAAPATEAAVTALSQQLDAVTTMMNDANQRAEANAERAARSDTVSDHLRDRLTEARDENAALLEKLTAARRRWWRR